MLGIWKIIFVVCYASGLKRQKKKKKFQKLFSSDLQQSEWQNADYSVVTINLQCFILQHKFAAF